MTMAAELSKQQVEEVAAVRRAKDIIWNALSNFTDRNLLPAEEVQNVLLDAVNALRELEKETIHDRPSADS